MISYLPILFLFIMLAETQLCFVSLIYTGGGSRSATARGHTYESRRDEWGRGVPLLWGGGGPGGLPRKKFLKIAAKWWPLEYL
jgi:hypothetical protein